jgi:hypothetical protein
MPVHLADGAQHIMEDVVETDIAEAQFIDRCFELRLTVRRISVPG